MFNDLGFATFNPGSASAQARSTAKHFVPTLGQIAPSSAINGVGLVVVVLVVLGLEHLRRRARR